MIRRQRTKKNIQNKTIKTRKIMAKVELPKGIIAIHGRMGDYIYRWIIFRYWTDVGPILERY